jgi:hypothetical protein
MLGSAKRGLLHESTKNTQANKIEKLCQANGKSTKRK